MQKRKATSEFLRKYLQPNEWYEYRDLLRILPLSSATIVRLLDKTPHTIIKKRIEGSALPYPRKVRIFPGGALIDAAREAPGNKNAKVLEYDHRGYVSGEDEFHSASEGD